MEQLKKEETIALRSKVISEACQLFFKEDPLKIVRAKGQYMFDERGNAYLDCINNVAHVGHCHPNVVNAGCHQMTTLNTNMRFLHDNIVLCGRRITDTLPDNLSVCFFVNSGSEANDLAIRLAQIHTGGTDIVALEHAYHGHLTSLIDISHYKFNLPGGVGQKNHVHIASCPDIYRGKYRGDKHSREALGELYAEEVENLCKNVENKGSKICAFIAESLLSCGGQIIPPRNYFAKVYEHIRNAGGVCIADEVQVGFGRIGRHWWAFQEYDVIPDIVTMGKSMGNGHPVACVVTTQEIADSFLKTGVKYFNTYGGNPVSCAIASAVLDTVNEENLREKALIVGEYLRDSLYMMGKKHKCVGDVRGIGLFVGVDLVKDKETRESDKDLAEFVVLRMRDERILVSADGPEENVIKFKPPMVFTKENVDEVVSKFDEILKEAKRNSERSRKTQISSTSTSNGPSKDIRPRKKIHQKIKSI